jgi:hypothetical protein
MATYFPGGAAGPPGGKTSLGMFGTGVVLTWSVATAILTGLTGAPGMV